MNLFLKKTPSKRVGKDKNFIRYLTNFLKFFFKILTPRLSFAFSCKLENFLLNPFAKRVQIYNRFPFPQYFYYKKLKVFLPEQPSNLCTRVLG